MSHYAPLKEALGSRLLENEPLARHTTWRIGGPADAFAVAKTVSELVEWAALATRRGLPWKVIGNGSNLLVADEGVRALVIKNACARIEIDERGAGSGQRRVRAEAGAMLARVANLSASAGLAGFEFAAGIPGTVGGAVVNNAGAHGSCMAEVLDRVDALSSDARLLSFALDDLELAYRSSRFKTNPGAVVLAAELLLLESDAVLVRRRLREFTRSRTSSQPLTMPSAGSVFKNPEGSVAGMLIEQCGLKGRRVGGAQISTKHANFIVNTGGARAADVLALVELARSEVERRTGLVLEPEIETFGFLEPCLA